MEKFKERWKVQESQSGKPNYNIVGEALGGKYKIARVPFMLDLNTDLPIPKLKLEALEHATLMAAAPELLEALQSFCDKCNEFNIEALAPEYEAAMTVINKSLYGKVI